MALFHDLTDYVEIPPLKNSDKLIVKAVHVEIARFDHIAPLEPKFPEPASSFAPPQGKNPRGGRARTKEAIARRKKQKAKKLQSQEIRATYRDLLF